MTSPNRGLNLPHPQMYSISCLKANRSIQVWNVKTLVVKPFSTTMSSLHRRLHGIFNSTSVRATTQTNTVKASARSARSKEGRLNALIKGYVIEGNLEEAKWWFDHMGEGESAPGKKTFEIVVPFVCEKGELELAFDLCMEIFKRKFLVDVSLLQLVVNALVKESKMEEAKKLVQLGKRYSYCRYDLKLP